MNDLFNSGIRPAIDEHIAKLAEERRDYGNHWSASSAGYCMRKNIYDRLQVPYTTEKIDEARKQRVFSAGHIFHSWVQEITKASGLSIAQELELIDDDLMVKGHIDDLVLVGGKVTAARSDVEMTPDNPSMLGEMEIPPRLILYDYKTRNSKNWNYSKVPSFFHKMQTGTYMYILRNLKPVYEGLQKDKKDVAFFKDKALFKKDLEFIKTVSEARVLNIEKDTLRMSEVQYLYSDELEKEVVNYWTTLNKHWNERTLPPCTCHEQAGGFMAKEKYNNYFYEGEPCSIKWFQKHPEAKARWT